MELAIFVWLASVVGSISTLISFTGTMLIFVSLFIYGFKILPSGEEKAKLSSKPYIVSVIVGFCACLLSALLPTQNTMYLMAAAYAGQNVVQSQAMENVVKIVNLKLEAYLKELEKVEK